jgi:hypothetical protein
LTVRINDPYTCGSNITGQVLSGAGARVVTVRLYRIGQASPAFTFTPIVNIDGTWLVAVDYNLIPSATYTNVYSVVDGLGNTASGQYELQLKKPSECGSAVFPPSVTTTSAGQLVVLDPFKQVTNSATTTGTNAVVPTNNPMPAQTVAQSPSTETTTTKPSDSIIIRTVETLNSAREGLVRTGGASIIGLIVTLIVITILGVIYYKNNHNREVE